MTTLFLQPDATAGLDAQMASSAPTTNYGTATTISAGYVSSGSSIRRSVIKFDLSSLPAGAVVTSATLQLYCSTAAGTAYSLYVYPLLVAFVEGEVTWNIRQTGTNWNTGGAGGVGTDRDGTRLASVSAPAGPGIWVSFALTPAWFEDVADGVTTNHGFVLVGSVESGAANQYSLYRSSDWGTASQRPKLTVVYETGATLTPAAEPVLATLPVATVVAGAVSIAAPVAAASTTVPAASLVPGAVTLAPAAVAIAASVPGGALDTSVRFQPPALAVPGTMPAATVGLGPVTLAPGVAGAAPTLLATTMALGAVAITPSALPVSVVVMGGSVAPELSACLAVADTSATAMLLADTPVTIMDLVCTPVAALALAEAPAAVLVLGHARTAELVLADECEGQPWPT